MESDGKVSLSRMRFDQPPPNLSSRMNNPPPMTPDFIRNNPYFEFIHQTFGNISPACGSPNPSERSGWSTTSSGSPTFYPDPFQRGDVPFEVNGREVPAGIPSRRETKFEFPTANTSGLNQFFRVEASPVKLPPPPSKPVQTGTGRAAPNPYVPRAVRHKVKYDYCVFCKNNGEDERFYLSHTLKDDTGVVTCPILHTYKCPICGATGNIAHTLKYCPKNRDGTAGDDLLSINALKTMKSAAGSRRNVTSLPVITPISRVHGRQPMAKLQGPNAAWTGITTQPVITPMFGEMINSQHRERKYGYPPTM